MQIYYETAWALSAWPVTHWIILGLFLLVVMLILLVRRQSKWLFQANVQLTDTVDSLATQLAQIAKTTTDEST